MCIIKLQGLYTGIVMFTVIVGINKNKCHSTFITGYYRTRLLIDNVDTSTGNRKYYTGGIASTINTINNANIQEEMAWNEHGGYNVVISY